MEHAPLCLTDLILHLANHFYLVGGRGCILARQGGSFNTSSSAPLLVHRGDPPVHALCKGLPMMDIMTHCPRVRDSDGDHLT